LEELFRLFFKYSIRRGKQQKELAIGNELTAGLDEQPLEKIERLLLFRNVDTLVLLLELYAK